VDDAGDAEVAEQGHGSLGHLQVDQHVLGLEVAVRHASLVDEAEPAEHLAEQLAGKTRAQRGGRGQQPAKVAALDHVHDDRQGVALGHEVPNSRQVGMPQRGEDGPLLHEAGHRRCVRRQLRT